MLFHEAALRNDEGVVPRNASLRRLDQSWRLAADNRREVIVVGRVPADAGATGASRLIINDGKTEPGSVRQESFVRLYLPVK
jgi:hypothetical protein